VLSSSPNDLENSTQFMDADDAATLLLFIVSPRSGNDRLNSGHCTDIDAGTSFPELL
jgi:hypothetical protein